MSSSCILRISNVETVIIDPRITIEQKMKKILKDSMVLIQVKGPRITTTIAANTHIEINSPDACLTNVYKVFVKKATCPKVKPKHRIPIII